MVDNVSGRWGEAVAYSSGKLIHIIYSRHSNVQGSTVPSEARLAENKCMLVIAEIQESVLQLLPSLPLDYVVTGTAELGAGDM
ncbi:hypothetical protein Zm00014a_032114 [Zea mays]|uniref:Uncharacterized protein n=1 Tax=Zea mays TaxID=4577 RepID=A0A317Y1R2_MAIZE|nr:hypothetical protein Zm00014a_032114 [Zea mays]